MRPRARAASKPSRVRSAMRSRSNCAMDVDAQHDARRERQAHEREGYGWGL